MRKLKAFVPLVGLLYAAGAVAETSVANYDAFPAKDEKRSAPVLIFVHGGAWIGGDKSQHRALGESFAARGICAVNLNYRLAPKYSYPAAAEDLEHALKQLPAKLPKNCDGEKIFLAGHSAGAHTIAAWNTLHRNQSVKGLIGLEGIYDLPNLAERWPTYPEWFLKKAFGAPEKWAAASPSRRPARGKAPWLLIHSDQDELVDLTQSNNFAKHLRGQKISVETLWLPKGLHDEVVKNFGQAGDPATEAAVKFIRP